ETPQRPLLPPPPVSCSDHYPLEDADADLTEWQSGVVAEGGPSLCPRRPQPGGQIDRHALLVIADSDAVAERRDLPHSSEHSAQQRRVKVDGDSPRCRRRAAGPTARTSWFR